MSKLVKRLELLVAIFFLFFCTFWGISAKVYAADNRYTQQSIESMNSKINTTNDGNLLDKKEEILFIDSAVKDYSVFKHEVKPNVKTVVLDSSKDELYQISEFLKDKHDISAIHLISHGAPGKLFLGDGVLSSDKLTQNDSELQIIGKSLSKNGSILLYGCDVAKGNDGIEFVNKLAKETGAVVAASNNSTGASKLGGDWKLEATTGIIVDNKVLYFPNYLDVLATYDLSGVNINVPETNSASQDFGGLTITAYDMIESHPCAYANYDDNGDGYLYVSGTDNQNEHKLTIEKTTKATFVPSSVSVQIYSLAGNFTVNGYNGTTKVATKSYSVTIDEGFSIDFSTLPDFSCITKLEFVAEKVPNSFDFGIKDLVIKDDVVPNVTGISPAEGVTSGNQSVIITGTNFTGVTSVKFGSNQAVSFNVDSGTQITAITPGEGIGTVDVTVGNSAGTSSIGVSDKFTYIAEPTVTGISPISGPTAGGTSVTITGTNLTGATAVKFGSNTGVITANTATSITATAPAGSEGTVDVTVAKGVITSSISANDHFTYVGAPTVSSISPNAGSTSGSTSVTITGTDLTGATSVTIGGIPVSGYTVVNATTITATTPAGTEGATNVVVTTPGGTATGTGIFTYVEIPTVTGISPISGLIAGGTSVTITGTNLTGATAVKFGNNTGVITANTATSITATAPAGIVGTVDVIVEKGVVTSLISANDQFTYVRVPSILSISPNAGSTSGSTSVTITGTDLTGATSVTIGGIPVSGYTVVNATTITATTSARTEGATNVVVITPGGTATGLGMFTYVEIPTVTGISPISGPTAGGTSVTITGTNLTGATAVKFGGNTGVITANTATSITAKAPAGSVGTVDVIVAKGVVTSLISANDQFTYFGVPSISSISPNAGSTSGSTSVTITGTDLTGATSVTIGGIQVSSYTVVNATTITATTPAGTEGATNVVVTTPGGSAIGTGIFTYVEIPTVTGISPISGPTAGGTSVTITGTNLTGATAVKFGSNTGVITANTATSITATAPAGSEGTVDVIVAKGVVTSSISANDQFTYFGVPTVSSISPNAGSTSGSTSVTITGTNLTGATAVTIGGIPVSGYTVVNATTITATTPAGTEGATNVVVTTPGGTATGTGIFTYVEIPTVTGISPASGPTAGGTTVTITGTNLTGATAVNFGGIAGSITSNTATEIVVTAPAGTGEVDVTVTTAEGTSVTSSADKFTYVASPVAPSITTQPSSKTVTVGNAVSFSVSATGEPTLAYQWKKDGVDISGATTATLSISNAQTTDAGNYIVKVSNGAGNVTSAAATLTVNAAEPTEVILTTDSLGKADDSKVTGLTEGHKYQVGIGGTLKYVKENGTLSTSKLDLGDLIGTEITGLTNGETYNVQEYTTSAAVTVVLDSGSLGTAGDECITGLTAGNKYKVIVNGVTEYVKSDGTLSTIESEAGILSGTEIVGLTNGITYKVEQYTTSSSSGKKHRTSTGGSGSSLATGKIIVNITDGSSDKSVSQTEMERTTSSNGNKTDTVNYTADKAKETVKTLASQGKDVVRIIATDADETVTETKVNISKDTLSVLSSANINLEIETNGAIVSVPKESVQGLAESEQLNGDLYFRVVPIKDEAKQKEIKITASKEAEIKAASGNNEIQVLGTPMTIQTNMSKGNVDIILPLTGVTLPADASEREALFNDLGVFIEHSDGEKVFEKGTVVEYKPGVYGIKFTVTKFSNFTIVKLNKPSIQPGWTFKDGYWYFVENDGTMAKGWHKANSGEWTYHGKDTVDTWFHLESDGKMDTGWFKDTDGTWYFLKGNGAMATNWQEINGIWYYFNSNGSMASDTVIEGYTLNSSGALIK